MAICADYSHTDVVPATDRVVWTWRGHHSAQNLCDHHASALVIRTWSFDDLKIVKHVKI